MPSTSGLPRKAVRDDCQVVPGSEFEKNKPREVNISVESGTEQPSRVLHYQFTREDFAVSDDELHQLERSVDSDWREPCLFSLSIFLATGLNAVGLLATQIATPQANQLSFASMLPLFLNSVVAVATLCSGISFGLAWKRNGNPRGKLINKIRNREEFDLAELRRLRLPSKRASLRTVSPAHEREQEP